MVLITTHSLARVQVSNVSTFVYVHSILGSPQLSLHMKEVSHFGMRHPLHPNLCLHMKEVSHFGMRHPQSFLWTMETKLVVQIHYWLHVNKF